MDNSFAYLGMQQQYALKRQQMTLADMNAARAQQVAMERIQAQQQQMAMQAQQQNDRLRASLADAAANRQFQMQTSRERLAQSDVQDQRAHMGQAYQTDVHAAAQRGQMQEQAFQSDRGDWEKQQQLREQGSQFDATRGDRRYEFDAAHGEQARQFDATQQQQRQMQQSQFQHADDSQTNQNQQQAGMAQMQAGIHDWLSSQDLSRHEQLTLQRMQQAVGEVNSDPNLAPWEKAAALTKLKTGIDPLQMRSQQMQMKQQEQHAELYHQEAARQQAVEQENSQFRAKTFDQRTSSVTNPVTGEMEYWLDLGLGKAPHRVFDTSSKIDSQKTMLDWTHKYMEAHVNADGTPVSATQAKSAYDELVGTVRGKTKPQVTSIPGMPGGTFTPGDDGAQFTPNETPAKPELQAQPQVTSRKSYEAQQAAQTKTADARKAKQEDLVNMGKQGYDTHRKALLAAEMKNNPGGTPDLQAIHEEAMVLAKQDQDAWIELHGTDDQKMQVLKPQIDEVRKKLAGTQAGWFGLATGERDALQKRYDDLRKKIDKIAPAADVPPPASEITRPPVAAEDKTPEQRADEAARIRDILRRRANGR